MPSASQPPDISDPLAQALLTDPATWKPWVATCLAEQAEDALAGSKAGLAELSASLVSCVRTAYRAAPVEVQAVLRGEGRADLRAAYQLGQLAFAQLLISHALGHRADDDFLSTLQGERHANLVRHMATQDDCSVEALTTSCGLEAAEVRLRLRELIVKGACDFRSDGRATQYFLTHAGKSGWDVVALP